LVRRSEQRRVAAEWLKQVGLGASPDDLVEHLPLAAQQLLEIAKAVSVNARVIVMDEPTSALSASEVHRLFKLIDQLKAEGRGIVYITHKMEEIEILADRITVLRDGAWVGSSMASDLPAGELVRWMVGREVGQVTARPPVSMGEERMRVARFSVRGHNGRDLVRNIDVSVRCGEIVGIAGLQDSGAAALLEGLFGSFGDAAHGDVWLNGKPVSIQTPRDAIHNGLALVTSDRKLKGLNLDGSVVHNAALAALPRLSPWCWRNAVRERETVGRQTDALRLKAESLDTPAWQLSGGNQQKIVLAKWLVTEPQVWLMDEPTRGVDVGAKEEIYKLIHQWAEAGMAILLNSTELPELLALSDRIIVLHRGEITAGFQRIDATPERILAAAMGECTRQ
jgi:ribose transport system ATP-binding protein